MLILALELELMLMLILALELELELELMPGGSLEVALSRCVHASLFCTGQLM
jgi:hypothetical protein